LENELLESSFSGNKYRELDLVCQVGENGGKNHNMRCQAGLQY